MQRLLVLVGSSLVVVLALVTLGAVRAQDATPGPSACADLDATPTGRSTPAAAATADGTPGAGAGCVEVSLVEWAVEMPAELPAGPVTFRVTDDGEAEHNFEVEGQGVEEELAANLAPGETAELTLDLEPGTYEVYCPIPGHREAGMEIELTVR